MMRDRDATRARVRQHSLRAATAAATAAALLSSLCAGTPMTRAATITWDRGGNTSNWSTGTNWSGSNVEPGIGDDVVFPATVPGGIGTIFLSDGEAARSITFNENYDLSFGSLSIGQFDAIGLNTAAGTSIFVDSALVGSAGLTKRGAGSLTLLGANTFTGDLKIFEGTVRVSADGQFGAAGNDVRFGGPLASTPVLAATTSFATSRDWLLDFSSNGVIDVAAGATLTKSGGIIASSGSGFPSLHKSGGGTLVLSAPNSLSGLRIDAGTVRLGVDQAWNSFHGEIFGAVGATLDLGGFDQDLRFFAGGMSVINSGMTRSTLTIITGPEDSTFSGSISGDIAFVHGAQQTVTFLAANSYGGGTTVNGGGMLVIGADDRLGVANTTLTLDDGALKGVDTFTLPRPVIAGEGGGRFDVVDARTVTLTGNVSGGGALVKSGPGTLVLGGALASGHGATTVTAGTLVLQKDAPGTNAAPADVTVGDGSGSDMLVLAQSEQIADSAAVTIASSGVLALSTFTETITSLTVHGGGAVTGGGGGGGTLILGGGGGVTTSPSPSPATIAPHIDLADHLQLFVVPDGAADADLIVLERITNGRLAKIGGGRMDVKRFEDLGAVTIIQGTIRLIESGGVSVVSSIDHGIRARLDLADNKLIVTAGDVGTADGGGAYSGLSGMIQSAYRFSAWDGPGITTTQPHAASGLTTVAIATGAQLRGLGLSDTDTWAGRTITGASVLLMYTYAGDLNLDGRIDAQDYGIIDNWVQFPGTSGYANGDINYDGVIDAVDYGIIDNSIQLQGAPIAAGAMSAGGGGVTSVPEPAAWGLGIVALAGFLSRRR